jgi:SP family general alpha glucoside:H+ symporter-like MFS transporter
MGAKVLSGFGVGSVQMMTGLYVTELAPAKIRGFLLIGYSFNYGFGQLCASIALKVLNDRTPMVYLTAIYVEFAMLGIMLAVYLVIPETPYWCANSGNHERGRAVIQRLNGGISGYDVDYHYNLIRRTVDKEKSYQKQLDGDGRGFLQELANVKEVLVGINGVSRGSYVSQSQHS